MLTAADLPGKPTYGLLISDQPVLADDVVRFEGEPVALVAAKDMETCRRALASIDVSYEVLVPLTDPERAQESPPVHPEGNIVRRVPIKRGDSRRGR